MIEETHTAGYPLRTIFSDDDDKYRHVQPATTLKNVIYFAARGNCRKNIVFTFRRKRLVVN